MFVEGKRAAGIERVVGIKIRFECFEQFELFASDRAFEVRRKEFAYAVMVRKCRARLHNRFQNGTMILSERVEVGRLYDEDEIEVCALRITVRDMASADCVRPRFDNRSHLVVYFGHIVPVDRTFESVDDDAVVLNGVAKIRVGESAVFPRSGDVAREIESVILSCNLADVAINVSLQSAFAVAEAEKQTSRMLFVAFCREQRFERRTDDSVHMRHHIRFFRVRKTECRRMSELTLHNLSHNRHTVFPSGEHKRKLFVLFREIEHFERNFGENTEAAFASHHNLVYVGAGSLSRRAVGLYRADGRCVLLFENDVRRAAVIGRILTRTASDDPTAYARILERLRKMSASVTLCSTEVFGGVVEDVFELRTADTGLHCDGLIDFVERNDLVEVFADVNHNVGAYHCFRAARDGRAACVDVHFDAVVVGVFDEVFDLSFVGGIDDDVGHVFDDTLSQSHNVNHRFAVCEAHSFKVVGGCIVRSYDNGDRFDLLFCERAVNVHVNELFARIDHSFEVVVGEREYALDEFVKTFFGRFVFVGIAPFHNGTEGSGIGCVFDPYGFVVFVGF